MLLSTLTIKFLCQQFPFCDSVPKHVAEIRENICRVFDCLYSFLFDALLCAAWTCLPLSVPRARFSWSSTENIPVCEILKQECHTCTNATVSTTTRVKGRGLQVPLQPFLTLAADGNKYRNAQSDDVSCGERAFPVLISKLSPKLNNINEQNVPSIN